ncbi:MAG: hypothetical protein Q9222_007367 [Ikaeria aurantiellina]
MIRSQPVPTASIYLLALLTLLTITRSHPLTPPPTSSVSPLPSIPPGPIPFSNPNHGGLWPISTTSRYNSGLSSDPVTIANMSACLTNYSIGRFYDSWDGNVCNGMGWFKGSANDKINPYDCYQACAPWVLYDGVENKGAKDYLCDLRRGVKGHCWMGYHQLNGTEGGDGTGGVETS